MAEMFGFSSRRGKKDDGETYPEVEPEPPAPVKPVVTKKAKPAAASILDHVSDDLTAKTRAWAHQVEKLYVPAGDAPEPAGFLNMRVRAVTGMKLGEPFWLAAVSGKVDETGSSTPLAEPVPPNNWPPKGAPSWPDDPLTLPVHDVAADLLLFLCDAAGTSATRACVGRAIVPLTELLPANPLCASKPRKVELWAQIFPAAPEYAAGQVHTMLGAADPRVPGSGMARSAALGTSAEPPRVLLELELCLERAVIGEYMFAPPFDALAEHPGSSRHERPPLPPERLLLAVERARRILDGFRHPAALRLAVSRPWSMGFCLLLMAYWLCFACPLPLVPAWIFAFCVLNSVALATLGHPHTEPFATAGEGSASDDPAFAPPPPPAYTLTAEEKLRRLEDTLGPVLTAVESVLSNLERMASLPAAADARAALLASLVIVFACAASAAVLSLASAAFIVAGGINWALFDACAVLFLLNLAAFHKRELAACMGDTRAPYDDEHAEAIRAAQSNPFNGRAARGASAVERPAAQQSAEPDWLDSERQRSFTNAFQNVWRRLPDAPTQVHRAIACAALQPADEREASCLSKFLPC